MLFNIFGDWLHIYSIEGNFKLGVFQGNRCIIKFISQLVDYPLVFQVVRRYLFSLIIHLFDLQIEILDVSRQLFISPLQRIVLSLKALISLRQRISIIDIRLDLLLILALNPFIRADHCLVSLQMLRHGRYIWCIGARDTRATFVIYKEVLQTALLLEGE